MIKKKRLTKEEKQAIKEFKTEEKENRISKEHLSVKKEHILLGIAIVILIGLVIGLIYFIFFTKKYEVIVPDLPEYEIVDVGVVDFEDEASNVEDLNTKKVKELDVTYSIVSDYYKKGILLSNTQVDYVNSSFLITSGSFSKDPFVSKVSLDGKLNWITKLNDKDFDNVYIYTTKYINGNYFAFTIAQKNNKKSLVVFKVDNNGKIVTNRIIASEITGKIQEVVVNEEKISIIINDNQYITAYFTDDDLENNNKLFDLKKTKADLESSVYLASMYLDNQVQMIVKNNGVYYLVTISDTDATATASLLESVNNIKTDLTIRASGYLKGFILYTNKVVYKLDIYNELLTTMDYSKVKLEDDSKFKEKYKDDEYIDISEMTNSIYLNKITVDEGKIVVNANTLYSSIYDVYDSNLKISKRYMLDTFKYFYDDGVILNSFYINDSIYEVYSYGTKTPSIMISKIG